MSSSTEWYRQRNMFVDWRQDGFLESVRKLSEDYVLVVANGCFDLLHPGHVNLLEWAKNAPFAPDAPKFDHQQSLVIAAVNSDACVARLKGPQRPIMPLADRMFVLTGLRSVSMAVGFAEDTPVELFKELPPFVLVKGEEYAKDPVPGKDIALWTTFAPMIQMQTLRGERDYSTSEVVQRVRDAKLPTKV